MSYKAEIIADSTNQQGNRITTFVVSYPRIVHAEMCRHRKHSRNTASSRAIPFKKTVKDVEENPFIPIAFQKPHSGMQGTEYYDHTLKEESGGLDYTNLIRRWLRARDTAVSMAKIMADENLNMPITKQLCNRLLEPFVWVTEIITATEWANFFNLRCPQYHTPVSGENFYFRSKRDCISNHSNPNNISKLENMSLVEWLQTNKSQADIHIQAIAELMWDAYNESIPKQLKAGEWHFPFADNIDTRDLLPFMAKDYDVENPQLHTIAQNWKIKIATARCARISYKNFEGKDDYDADIKLHNRLASMKHWSPFEHCARAMSDKEYSLYRVESPDNNELGMCRNFKGFIPYRHLIEE